MKTKWLGHACFLISSTSGLRVITDPYAVGGFFTIDATVASQVCDQLEPKVVIPMHFKTPKCSYPTAGIENLLKGKMDVRKAAGSEVVLERGKLPATTEIVLLQPAL